MVSLDLIPNASDDSGSVPRHSGSVVTHPRVMGIYDLDPGELGLFDLVMFFGLLYHLRHPLLGLEKVASVTDGTLLVQSHTVEVRGMSDIPLARFRRDGVTSGPGIHDPTVYWEPNAVCVRDMLIHVGFTGVERVGAPTSRSGRRQ